jgi:uncharacterized protein (DUF1697 family)
LLRGINVGGSNVIRMADLRTCFEGMGLTDVITYIQSGNILFRTQERNRTELTRRIEKTLTDTFHYDSRVVLLTHDQLEGVVRTAPRGFGKNPGRYRYDVIFLKEPLTAKTAMRNVTVKEGVDQAFEGKGVLYFSRLIARASQSRLTKIISLPVYQSMTIRNWNTTTKLLALMDRRSGL